MYFLINLPIISHFYNIPLVFTFVGKCAPHWRQIDPNQIGCTFMVNWQAKKYPAAIISSIKIIRPFLMQPSKAKPWHGLQMCFTDKLVCSGIRRYFFLTILWPFYHGRGRYWFRNFGASSLYSFFVNSNLALRFLLLINGVHPAVRPLNFTPALLRVLVMPQTYFIGLVLLDAMVD